MGAIVGAVVPTSMRRVLRARVLHGHGMPQWPYKWQSRSTPDAVIIENYFRDGPIHFISFMKGTSIDGPWVRFPVTGNVYFIAALPRTPRHGRRDRCRAGAPHPRRHEGRDGEEPGPSHRHGVAESSARLVCACACVRACVRATGGEGHAVLLPTGMRATIPVPACGSCTPGLV